MYFDGCKYGKGGNNSHINKFRLAKEADDKEESDVAENMHRLADIISPLYEKVAPKSYKNMTAFSSVASDCRIGYGKNGLRREGMPFSGVTTVCDFCAHSHRDTTNMNGGATVIVTLLKPENRGLSAKPDDEQLHVLPHYAPDDTDEFGRSLSDPARLEGGALQVLPHFERTLITRSKPKKGCKRGHPTGERKKFLDR